MNREVLVSDGIVQRDLQDLFNYFRRRLETAQAQPDGFIEGYILVLTTLDALANYESGSYSSAENFADFVLRYSGLAQIYWRTSLPVLVQYLSLGKPRTFGAVAKWVKGNYQLDEHCTPRRICRTEEDPEWDTFWEALQSSGLQLPSNCATELQRFVYARLLWYQYRNYAIHRLTIRDEAPNITGETEPYYMNETVSHAMFECGRIGFRSWIVPLMIDSDIRELPASVVVEEISEALRNPEAGARPGLQLEPAVQWAGPPASSWRGHLTVGTKRYTWVLTQMYDLQWVNFGIPRPFIVRTLANAINNLQGACEQDPRLAGRMWLNTQRRLA
jgi:hypothetical protein